MDEQTNIINPVTEKKKKWLERLQLWVAGIGSYYIFTWLYDYVVVSFFLIYLGLLKGTIVVIILSMLVDLATMKFYDWLKKDWLALETIKDLDKKEGIVGRLFSFVRGKGIFLTIIVLSLTSNAFVVTAYLRKGSSQYNGMALRDWLIFISSSLLINLYWVFVVGGGIELIKLFYYNLI